MELLRSVHDFFREAITSAIRNQGVQASEMTEFYLVNLLADFAHAPLDDAPLALELAEANLAPPEERASRLREVGDRSLYVSGFFAESLSRRLVDVPYYIDLGGAAYRQLAQSPTRSTAAWCEAYRELGAGFAAYVDVLAEVSEGANLTSNTGVVQLYERWLRTGSSWIGRRLRAQGVLPKKDGMQ